MSDLNISSGSGPIPPSSQPDSSSLSPTKTETSPIQDSIANTSSYHVLPSIASPQTPVNATFAVIDMLAALKIQLNTSDLIDIISQTQAATISSSSIAARKLSHAIDEREQLIQQRKDLIKQLDHSDLEDEEKQNIQTRLDNTNNRLLAVEINIKNAMQELNLLPIQTQENGRSDSSLNFEEIILILLLNVKTQDKVNSGNSSKGISQAEVINMIARLTAQEIVKESDFTLTVHQIIEEVKKNKAQLKELIENSQNQTRLKNTNHRI